MSEVRATAGRSGAASGYSVDLLAAIVAAIPHWVSQVIAARTVAMPGVPADARAAETARASDEMVKRVQESLSDLFSMDVEEQRANPLQILRREASVVTEALTRLGVPPMSRDEYDSSFLPGDIHGIGPLTWRDLGDTVHEAGITWGAWKAAVIISRHKSGSGERP